jgi:ABC-type lipoprotein release transport system permease subunit
MVLFGKYLLSRLLPGMLVSDMTTVVGISIFLVVAVLLACYIPARRAAHLDPMAALRQL